MGSSQSSQLLDEEEEEEDEAESEGEEVEEEEDEAESELNNRRIELDNLLVKKVLEQEPEMLPCHASASPLSPQLSSLGTPRIGPSIKVWDPYNVLAPPPPSSPPLFSRISSAAEHDRSAVTEVYFISHGECDLNLRPDLIGGRCHVATLTPNGKRQARALAVFLNSEGVRFTSVFSSPLDRARSMAVSVCQVQSLLFDFSILDLRLMNFPEEHLQVSDAVVEMSLGDWESCHRSEIYTPETLSLIERCQPDFSAPSGESLRQVEFRMVQFLNGTVSGLSEKLRSELLPSTQHTNSRGFSLATSIHRPILTRKKSGKSRFQVMNATGDHEGSEEIFSNHNDEQHLGDINIKSSSSQLSTCIGVFTHSLPIKCLLTGILGCSPVMTHKICVEDSSVTVLQHSWKTGWQVKRLNDTAHLRLL
nr:phosphoglycerate/bisphosphoglycerate mutase family protein [Overexpression vector pFC12850OE]